MSRIDYKLPIDHECGLNEILRLGCFASTTLHPRLKTFSIEKDGGSVVQTVAQNVDQALGYPKASKTSLIPGTSSISRSEASARSISISHTVTPDSIRT